MVAPEEESKLRVVAEPSDSAQETEPLNSPSDSTSAPAHVAGRRTTRRVWLWALLGLLVGLVVAFQQYRRAEGLVSQVESLNGALLEAEQQLEAYGTRFRDVRTSVGDLDRRVDALKTLVDTDPLQPLPPPPSAENIDLGSSEAR